MNPTNPTNPSNQLDQPVQDALNPNAQGKTNAGGDTAKDPVCGMMVNTRTAQNTISASPGTNNQPLYFCSPECKTLFEQDPAKYGYPNF